MSEIAAHEIARVKDSLKPFRPPTAPSSDLEKERKAITDDARRNLYFLQVALFLVVLVLLSYVTLPLEYANAISFLLLCVGIALGFFLKG
jgi:Ca2+/Na+ antiporter